MKLSPTGTPPSLASQSRTGSLHFDGKKFVDPIYERLAIAELIIFCSVSIRCR